MHTKTQPELIQHEIAHDNYQTAVIKTEDWVNGQESDPVLSKVRLFVALRSLPNPAQKRSLDPEVQMFVNIFHKF
ncbi:hypothetical protein DPMN_166983 [Dreissena polymorpha]|uniref:Uncharacterized protein n=1 Tax=Dreissena polymorpha TaxID=45954 RepID=A0A9D4EZW6_DREPO|nr:hypothetical protein DPMN_166983 [Dreissena polymorpha]